MEDSESSECYFYSHVQITTVTPPSAANPLPPPAPINNGNNKKNNYVVCFVQYVSFSMFCKERVAIYDMLCLSEDSPSWLDSLQLLLEICHLLGTEGKIITVSRVTLARRRIRLSYIVERAGSKDRKFI